MLTQLFELLSYGFSGLKNIYTFVITLVLVYRSCVFREILYLLLNISMYIISTN